MDNTKLFGLGTLLNIKPFIITLMDKDIEQTISPHYNDETNNCIWNFYHLVNYTCARQSSSFRDNESAG